MWQYINGWSGVEWGGWGWVERAGLGVEGVEEGRVIVGMNAWGRGFALVFQNIMISLSCLIKLLLSQIM